MFGFVILLLWISLVGAAWYYENVYQFRDLKEKERCSQKVTSKTDGLTELSFFAPIGLFGIFILMGALINWITFGFDSISKQYNSGEFLTLLAFTPFALYKTKVAYGELRESLKRFNSNKNG